MKKKEGPPRASLDAREQLELGKKILAKQETIEAAASRLGLSPRTISQYVAFARRYLVASGLPIGPAAVAPVPPPPPTPPQLPPTAREVKESETHPPARVEPPAPTPQQAPKPPTYDRWGWRI